MDLVNEADCLVRAASTEGVLLRMLGGVAIAMRCPSAREDAFTRTYGDLDCVIPRCDRGRIDNAVGEIGFEPDRALNAQRGNERRCYYRADGLKLDVWVESFSMCHDVPLGSERLTVDEFTVPLAELLLTKAQIVELNDKDAVDLFVLFLDQEITGDDSGINSARVGELCGQDWGLWRTVTGTLRSLEDATRHIPASPERRGLVVDRIEQLVKEMESAPKSRRWKLRNRVGDRLPWYTLPEEAQPHVDLRALWESAPPKDPA